MSQSPKTLTLQVKGMSCGHCVRAVTLAIQTRDEQAQVNVDLPTGQVTVITTASEPTIRDAIREEGYDVEI